MKHLFVFIFFSPVFLFSADLADIRSSVVKIISKGTATAIELRGRCLVFSKNSKFYVLTSDHVTIHTNSLGMEHTAINSATGESLKLKFLASEWGLGLALLEVQNPSPTLKAVSYEQLSLPSAVKVGALASFYGYPYDSNELFEEGSAHILNKNASLPYFVFAPELYEFDAFIGEFGMSGGPAFSHDGLFLGILAYQKILNGERGNRVYAIPESLVLNWLALYFKDLEKYLPYFSEPWWGQGQPDQIMLTNEKYFLGFRVFGKQVRMLAARMEALLILKEEPSKHYEDSRGILKKLRQDLDTNVMVPLEYSLIDRNLDTPAMITINYPAQAFVHMNRKGVSLFAARGERHEQRFARFRPIVDLLAKDLATMKTKMAENNDKAWVALTRSFDTLLERLNVIPPKPTHSGTEGASEFFSSHWLGNTSLLLEMNQKMPGWKLITVTAPQESQKIREDLSNLLQSLNVFEFTGS